MKRIINGVEIKYTAAGYVYKAGRRFAGKVKPGCWPKEITFGLTRAESDALAEMLAKTWTMC